MEFDIMFDDLKENIQKQLLEAYGVQSPEDMNWDVVPVATLYIEK